MDNWYTSVPLAKTLLRDHSLTLVGTMRKNKREIPSEFLPRRDRPAKQSLFGFDESRTLVSYVPKKAKAVVLMSTMHHSNTIDSESNEEKKPEIVTFYNATKGGVDQNDQMCASYNVGRRTRRWPVAIFFHLINTIGINAMVIYNSAKNRRSSMLRRKFLQELALALIRPHQLKRVADTHLPRGLRKRLRKQFGIEEEHLQVHHPVATRMRCFLCSRARNRSTKTLCSYCERNVCGEHMKVVCNECADD